MAYRGAAAQGAVAIAGPARSEVSRTVAQLAGVDQIPLLSFWASSPTLSDTATYPYFGRTYPSDEMLAYTLLELWEEFGWRSIGVLHVIDAFTSGLLR